MNRHSRLKGNDPGVAAGCVERGQRVFCSDRGQRGGCGRTFPIFLAEVLPRHSLTASWLWKCLLALLAGDSLRTAAQTLPFALETLYGVRRKMRRTLDVVRTRLWGESPPPASAQSDPMLQTLDHLRAVFTGSECAPAEFQLHFQLPFLG